ncbi:MAG: hypothetical protein JW827_01145 [Spirochaetes bacterium]|nr:hypothetical protein [Spirochaetota bacterium]
MDSWIVFDDCEISEMVKGGKAYEKAQVPVKDYRHLVVPDKVRIEQKAKNGVVEIYLEKVLSFMGHPPSPMNIKDAVKNFGIATRLEEDTLSIATYGEWWSKEGGVEIHLVIRTPRNLKIRKEKNLSGRQSLAHEKGSYPGEKQLKKCYWYGPDTPGEGWTGIQTVPDDDQNAKKD